MKRATDNRAAQLITMAGYLARTAVKEELRARGFEPEYLVEPAVISRLVRGLSASAPSRVDPRSSAHPGQNLPKQVVDFLLNYEHSAIRNPHNTRPTSP